LTVHINFLQTGAHFDVNPDPDPTVQIIYHVEVLFDREDTYLNLKNGKKNIQFNSKEKNRIKLINSLAVRNFTAPIQICTYSTQYFKIADS
jgi:hypothetical protein